MDTLRAYTGLKSSLRLAKAADLLDGSCDASLECTKIHDVCVMTWLFAPRREISGKGIFVLPSSSLSLSLSSLKIYESADFLCERRTYLLTSQMSSRSLPFLPQDEPLRAIGRRSFRRSLERNAILNDRSRDHNVSLLRIDQTSVNPR